MPVAVAGAIAMTTNPDAAAAETPVAPEFQPFQNTVRGRKSQFHFGDQWIRLVRLMAYGPAAGSDRLSPALPAVSSVHP